ncbi:MAG: CvpA family protein [Alphaproteobacteria bacterium]|nr:CvpA family protein [Alphaproteobacteria bacterium]
MIESLPVTVTDLAVVGFVALAGLLAFAWGFVRVVLVVAAWVGAIVVSVLLLPEVRPFARDLIPIAEVADAVAAVAVFIVAVILFSIAGDMVADAVRGTRAGFIDRALGLCFGVAIGSALVCAAYVGLSWLDEDQEQPEWLRSARLLPVVETGADWLRALVPGAAREAARAGAEARGQASGDVAPAGRARPRPDGDAEAGAGAAEQGYGARERGALNQLLRGSEEP